MNLSERQKGIVALVILTLFYASMGIFARYLNVEFKLFQQVYLRILAAVIVGAIIFSNQLDFSKFRKLAIKEWVLIIFRAVTYYVLGVTLFTKAIVTAKYSNVSFISAIPTTALLGFIILREKITWQKILFMLLAFFGVLLISVKDYFHVFSWGLGEFFALLSAIFVSLSNVLRKWQSTVLNNRELSEITLFFAFFGLLITSFFLNEGLPISGWSLGTIAVIILAGLANVVIILLTNFGFHKVNAVMASNILTLESVFAVLIGFLFYHELPILKELIGGALIISSVIQMNKLEAKEKS